jgi:hypothetical protein
LDGQHEQAWNPRLSGSTEYNGCENETKRPEKHPLSRKDEMKIRFRLSDGLVLVALVSIGLAGIQLLPREQWWNASMALSSSIGAAVCLRQLLYALLDGWLSGGEMKGEVERSVASHSLSYSAITGRVVHWKNLLWISVGGFCVLVFMTSVQDVARESEDYGLFLLSCLASFLAILRMRSLLGSTPRSQTAN